MTPFTTTTAKMRGPLVLLCVLASLGCNRTGQLDPEPLPDAQCPPAAHARASGAPTFEIPKLRGPVSDYAGLLTPEEEAKLASLSEALEKDIGSQLALLTIASLPSSVSIEEYSLAVANNWRLGRRKFNDGVLLTVAFDNRSLRIEVGCGLELAIPDAAAKQIIDDIVPEFRARRAYEGLELGLHAIAQRIRENRALVGRSARSGPLPQNHD